MPNFLKFDSVMPVSLIESVPRYYLVVGLDHG
jgi:hypothetical protein